MSAPKSVLIIVMHASSVLPLPDASASQSVVPGPSSSLAYLQKCGGGGVPVLLRRDSGDGPLCV